MKKVFRGFLMAVVACSFAMAGLTGCSGGDDSVELSRPHNVAVSYTVTFDSNGGSAVAPVKVNENNRVTQPASPAKEGFIFAGWYADPDFTEEYNFSNPVTANITLYARFVIDDTNAIKKIDYKGAEITLDDHNYYVDASLKITECGYFAFRSLQDAIANIPEGTLENPVTLYLASDVYWTDDYTVEARREKTDLVGLVVAQKYLTMRGVSGNRDDVVICSDRGQNAGADGNFNTMSISTGFTAYDITFANYCNVDLVYARDSSKNHEKRQGAITQAQVLITHDTEEQDYHYFENCSFVSRLNLLAMGFQKRSYFKDCHFECTDDSMPGGRIAICENCDIDWYSASPHWASASYLQMYLGCRIDLKDSIGSGGLLLSKYDAKYAFIDCQFTSASVTKAEWQKNGIKNETRCIVYNNTLNGEPFTISAENPNSSLGLTEATLPAFKIGEKYNIYNLLNPPDLARWDPANQVAEFGDTIQPWYVVLNPKNTIYCDGESSTEFDSIVYGGNVPVDMQVTLSLPEGSILTLNEGKVTCSEKVRVETIAPVMATTTNGLTTYAYVVVYPAVMKAPDFVSGPSLSLSNGLASLSYELSVSEDDSPETNPDQSLITWYRSSTADGADKEKVAESRYVYAEAKPYSDYVLRPGDIGKFLIVEIEAKQKNSNKGTKQTFVTSAAISESDVAAENKAVIDADFEHLVFAPVEYDAENDNAWTTVLKSGYWYGGHYLPKAFKEGGDGCDDLFSKKFGLKPTENPWWYGEGIDGGLGKYGYLHSSRGAKLLYNNEASSTNMKATLVLHPEKKAAQGFGSASQFADILIKYDQATDSGYGLRILRQAAVEEKDIAFKDYAAKSVAFKLIKYTNGSVELLADSVVSTAYLATCTVTINYENGVLSADVTTTATQGEGQAGVGMPHEVHLTKDVGTGCTASGFSFVNTGTFSNGNRCLMESVKLEY